MRGKRALPTGASFLRSHFDPDGDFSEAMRDDMRVFVRALARRYFQTIREALKKYDPKHLYLGSRFAWYTPESVEACAEFCDVMSFNIYRLKGRACTVAISGQPRQT